MAYLQRNLLSNPPVSPFSRSLKTHLFWFRGLQGLPPGATGIQWRVNIITFNRQSIIYHIQYVIVYLYRIAPPILYHLERLVFNRELKPDSTLHSPHSIICCILYLGLIIYHIAPPILYMSHFTMDTTNHPQCLVFIEKQFSAAFNALQF